MSTTIVTGIWDINRGSLDGHWKRDFSHYLDNFKKLLSTNINMIIYIESKYESFVWEHRKLGNTQVIIREIEWFKNNSDFYVLINNIRNNEKWYNINGWLKESTQCKLDLYNPIVMSKMFLLNDATILDSFNSTHFIWVDGGITNTVHEGYFNHDNVLNKIEKYFNTFTFVSFPYEGNVEIHGFEYGKICELSEDTVNKVARGGIFGGPKDLISDVNSIYYNLMYNTLSDGYMGTEESLFTIMMYKYPNLFQYYEINNDGLLATFFENLKNDELIPKREKQFIENKLNKDNVALYVITFNSPNQFETLCKSFEQYDPNYLKKPKKFLLNNSTDKTTDEKYKELCVKYDFREIKKDNIGICGGRQFIAEHAEENGFDYYLFFEDDMFFYNGDEFFCRNGFNRKIKDIYDKSIDIIWNENFDFLKLNFTEFFGDHSQQWAWYNVPSNIRKELFPSKPVRLTNNLNEGPPINFKNIKTYLGIPYINGEIYYSNWPQIVSRNGNKKMFLDTKWDHPYEQTWMSHIYQETVKSNIKPGLLLITPTEHNRFEFYPASERKEN